MKFALEQLGYGNVYHMSSIFDDEAHAARWIAALETKFNLPEKHPAKAEQRTRAYWEGILGGYGVRISFLTLAYPSKSDERFMFPFVFLFIFVFVFFFKKKKE